MCWVAMSIPGDQTAAGVFAPLRAPIFFAT